MTNSYENNPHDLLFGIDCQLLGNDPDNCPISTSASPTDPNSLNAFFQSIVHTSNNIFQPQPMLASSYHQLLHLPSEAPLQSGSFQQAATDHFANTHASPQSASSIFENDSFQGVHLPFEFLPLGAATTSLTDPTSMHTMANNSGLYHLSPYYQSLAPQNMNLAQAPDSQPGPSYKKKLQSVSDIESSQSSPGHDRKTQCSFQSEEQSHKCSEETKPPVDLDSAFSSCALAEVPSVAETTLVKSLSPSRSNKRSHSVTSACDSLTQLKNTTLSKTNPVVCRSWSKNQHKTSKLAMTTKTLGQSSPKIKSKNLRRNRVEKPYTQPNLISRSEHLTPSRPNVLSNKKINSNILPPTPDSLQRPKNQCCTSPDDTENAEECGKRKKQKIESIERALEALDTLTEYLSQEANECTSNIDDSIDYHNQFSPRRHHCNPGLSLVSPQHFFTLGELGGRLRRRLDVHRR